MGNTIKHGSQKRAFIGLGVSGKRQQKRHDESAGKAKQHE